MNVPDIEKMSDNEFQQWVTRSLAELSQMQRRLERTINLMRQLILSRHFHDEESDRAQAASIKRELLKTWEMSVN